MKRAAIYLRVSTQDQTTSNQEHELRQAAERADWQVAKVYRDHGISGAKGRNGRPAFDALCRDATKRQFDVVMAWNVDRLGRSLKDLVAFLSELHALGIDLFLHQQGLDTTTPAGKAMFQMLGVFAEFQRAITASACWPAWRGPRPRVPRAASRSAGRQSIPRAVRPSAPPTRLAELACELLLHSSVLVSGPFAAASVEAAATHPHAC